MYSTKQKILAALVLFVGLCGVLNFLVIKIAVAGLSVKQIAILALVPAIAFSFTILR